MEILQISIIFSVILLPGTGFLIWLIREAGKES